MSYCVNPECRHPQNSSTAKFCLNCGSHLLLRQRYRPIEPLGKGGFGKTFLALDIEGLTLKQELDQNIYSENQISQFEFTLKFNFSQGN
ncbi:MULTISPECIES: 4-Cys prefix domain-containing protein [unclassified Microcoleus]|uniref:4-Cys prefix domain-containing protein n=1 Tax=unclassified Microcoleus TaxID=2642155 RepID=UPI00312B4A09